MTEEKKGSGDAAYTDAWTQTNEVAQDFCELHFVSFLRHFDRSRCWLVYAGLRVVGAERVEAIAMTHRGRDMWGAGMQLAAPLR